MYVKRLDKLPGVTCPTWLIQKTRHAKREEQPGYINSTVYSHTQAHTPCLTRSQMRLCAYTLFVSYRFCSYFYDIVVRYDSWLCLRSISCQHRRWMSAQHVRIYMKGCKDEVSIGMQKVMHRSLYAQTCSLTDAATSKSSHAPPYSLHLFFLLSFNLIVKI